MLFLNRIFTPNDQFKFIKPKFNSSYLLATPNYYNFICIPLRDKVLSISQFRPFSIVNKSFRNVNNLINQLSPLDEKFSPITNLCESVNFNQKDDESIAQLENKLSSLLTRTAIQFNKGMQL